MTTSPGPERMRRVVVTGVGRVEVVDAAVPSPRPDELLVAMLVSGVCGSDTHAAAGHHPFIALPYAPGHEVVGRVEAVGAAVEGFEVGQRITVEPTLPCGSCKQCAAGRGNVCEHLRFFGCIHDQGGMAERFTIPADRARPVPEAFTDAQAALVEPLATPVHAVRLAAAGTSTGDLTGAAVAILGAGTIGLLLLAAARHRGARRIVMTDVLASKRERAARLGADAVVDAARPDVVAAVREELGESADVVFDCVGVQATVTAAISMALKAGTVVVVGVPAADVSIPLPVVQDQQVRLQGSATYTAEDFAEAVAIIAAGGVRAEDVVTATYPLAEAARAFEASASGAEVKVLVTADRTG